jgi:hypothetical protein
MNTIQARLAAVDKNTMQGVTVQAPTEIRVHKGIRRVVLDIGGGRMVLQLDRENATELAKQITAICLAMPKSKE